MSFTIMFGIVLKLISRSSRLNNDSCGETGNPPISSRRCLPSYQKHELNAHNDFHHQQGFFFQWLTCSRCCTSLVSILLLTLPPSTRRRTWAYRRLGRWSCFGRDSTPNSILFTITFPSCWDCRRTRTYRCGGWSSNCLWIRELGTSFKQHINHSSMQQVLQISRHMIESLFAGEENSFAVFVRLEGMWVSCEGLEEWVWVLGKCKTVWSETYSNKVKVG